MRALTLWQPWAQLLVLGSKRLETRSWPTAHRGPLAIHASSRYGVAARSTAMTRRFRAVLEAAGYDPRALPLGAIVGTVTVTGCCRVEDCWPWLTPIERAFGDFRPGRWAWVLTAPTLLPEPIIARGARGLWHWSSPETPDGEAHDAAQG